MAGGWTNKLFYGDNLDVLREHITTESVDLIYLDPPFNSNRSYNVLFKQKSGDDAQAQIERSTTPGTPTSFPATPTRRTRSTGSRAEM